ncbi:GEVED domain-containing protein [Akkermansiaceae bacterium]|nr:GEVED domain-containing protein [Akkermansiaceae bacterium]
MKPFSILSLTASILASPLSSLAKDYGDAPSSYGTLGADNGPSHAVIPTLFMGNIGPDDEVDGLPDLAALGDDLDTIDDEDALNNSSLIFLEGESYKLVVDCTNQTGNLAKLGVWVDWNRNGVFKTDAVEFAVADVPSAGLSQQISITLPRVPSGVVGGNPAGELSFIRLRLTTDLPALDSPAGSAIDGEVEDWQIQIFENYDYGDLSDIGPGTGPNNYRTNFSDGGPRHRLGRPVYLGQLVDGESHAQPQASALGDDNVGADEDGVSVSSLVPGLTATFIVSATNQTTKAALLRAEVDLNQNGNFSDPGESQTQAVPADSTLQPVTFDFPIPPGLPVGTSIATRFRISTDPLMMFEPDPITLNDGEVEDHLFAVTAGRDWGDLPDRCPGGRAGNFDRGGILPDYQTLAIDNGPSHAIIPGLSIANSGPMVDLNVDPEADGQPGPTADGDDTDGNHDDLVLQTALTLQHFILQPLGTDHSKLDLRFAISQAVENTTGMDATFYAFFDGNRDGDFDDPGERFTTIIPGDGSVTEAGTEFDTTIPSPGLRQWQESFALRCRISTDPNLGPNGPAPDGEVQDDIITATLVIGNPRPMVLDPDNEAGELIELNGDPIVAPLGVPFSPHSAPFVPGSVANPRNPIWSITLNGDVIAGGAINFSPAIMSDLGVGAHPMTLTFGDADTGDLYVIRLLLKIVDLPGYADWAEASNLPALSNRPDQDPDLDGFPNLVEFALGTRADLPDKLPTTPLSTGVDGDSLTMSYSRLSGGRITADGYRVGELLYRGEGTTDLINWEELISNTSNPIDLPMLPDDHHWSSFRLAQPISNNEKGFLRVKVEINCEEHP